MSEYIVSDMTYIAQNTYETCWLASYKMMLAWKGKSKELAEQLPNHRKMREEGIMDSQLLGCRKALNLSSSTYTGFKDVDAIESKLQKYGPIWVSGFFADGHKHIVVLYGVRGSGSSAQVLINDPLTGMSISIPKPNWRSLGWFTTRLNEVPYACQHWMGKAGDA